MLVTSDGTKMRWEQGREFLSMYLCPTEGSIEQLENKAQCSLSGCIQCWYAYLGLTFSYLEISIALMPEVAALWEHGCRLDYRVIDLLTSRNWFIGIMKIQISGLFGQITELLGSTEMSNQLELSLGVICLFPTVSTSKILPDRIAFSFLLHWVLNNFFELIFLKQKTPHMEPGLSWPFD